MLSVFWRRFLPVIFFQIKGSGFYILQDSPAQLSISLNQKLIVIQILFSSIFHNLQEKENKLLSNYHRKVPTCIKSHRKRKWLFILSPCHLYFYNMIKNDHSECKDISKIILSANLGYYSAWTNYIIKMA